MLTLLSECHFWTCRDDKIRIKDYDLGAFRYYTSIKRDFDGKDLIALGKKEYNEQRDGIVILTNDKITRLKDNIKKFEELIKMHKVVKADWKNGCVVQMLLDNGMIVHICVNNLTGDILRIAFDKFFIGKLASEEITDAIFSRQNILLAYNTNQVTVVHLQKPTMRRSSPEKIQNMDPKIYHVLIPGSTDKKLPRNLVVNRSFDLVIVWTKSSQNELFPWKPTYQDQDRANMHVFKLREDRLEAIGFCWTENEPLCTQFLRTDENKIITVEQKISRKGEISADICIYGIIKGRLQKISSHAIPIGSQISSHRFSPDQERLFLGTIDHCVCIYDIPRQKTKFLPKTDIAPRYSSWHSDSTIILIGNDEAQLQIFDYAFNPISNQLVSENVTPSIVLDISVYFIGKPKLLNACFSSRPDRKTNSYESQSDFFLLLIFEYGPIACIKFYSNSLRAESGLTSEILINKYLIFNQLDRAVNLLLCSNWETNSIMCLLALNKIFNYVVTSEDIKRSRNDLLKKALRSFTENLSDEVKDEYGDQVIDLRRKFFFFLLRNKLYNESLEIARSVLDYDLFMDLFNCTKSDPNLISITHEAYHQAEKIVNQTEKDSKSSKTSEDSEKNNSDENDETTSNSSVPSCPDYMESSKLTSVSKEAYRRRSLSAGRDFCSSYEYKNKYEPIASSKDIYFRNHIQQLTVKRYNPTPEETQFLHINSKNYVPPLKSYKSAVNKAASIKINKPQSMEIPDSPNVSNGCFRLLKKPKDLSSKYCNKSNCKDEVDRVSSITASTGKSLKSSNFQLTELMPRKSRKKSLEMYMQASTSTHFHDPSIGVPLSLPHIPPLTFQSSVGNAQQLIPRPSTTCNPINDRYYNNRTMSPERLPMRDLKLGYMNEGHPNISISNSPPKYSMNNALFNRTETITDPYVFTPKYYQHPLVLGNIPSSQLELHSAINQSLTNISGELVHKVKKPTASILSSSSNGSGALNNFLTNNNNIRFEAKKDLTTEKNKVKFSDTVHVAVVPELSRKDRPVPMKRNGFLLNRVSSKQVNLMDPKKELAESLPLCNPNDEYLKNFNRFLEDENVDHMENKLTENVFANYLDSTYSEVPNSIVNTHYNSALDMGNNSMEFNSTHNLNNNSSINYNNINMNNNNNNINNSNKQNNANNSSNSSENKTSSGQNIKVVHFGVV